MEFPRGMSTMENGCTEPARPSDEQAGKVLKRRAKENEDRFTSKGKKCLHHTETERTCYLCRRFLSADQFTRR